MAAIVDAYGSSSKWVVCIGDVMIDLEGEFQITFEVEGEVGGDQG